MSSVCSHSAVLFGPWPLAELTARDRIGDPVPIIKP
jgi:hypothetical protein